MTKALPDTSSVAAHDWFAHDSNPKIIMRAATTTVVGLKWRLTIEVPCTVGSSPRHSFFTIVPFVKVDPGDSTYRG